MTRARRTIQLQIPEDAEDGDTLTFCVDGVEMEIPIPQGSVAGQILEIMVGDDASEENDVEEQIDKSSEDQTIVHLDNSIQTAFTIYNKIPKDASEVTTETTTNSSPCDGTYEMIWSTGLALSKFVSSPSFHHLVGHPSVCLELGSGTGVVGLSYAVSCIKEKDYSRIIISENDHSNKSNKRLKSKSTTAERKLILTDLSSALPILRYNIEKVDQELGQRLHTEFEMEASRLVWGQTDVHHHDVDLILASDVLYNATMETYQSLKSTIESIDTKGTTKIVIAVRWRKPEEERRFFQLMCDAGYEFHLLHGTAETCSLGWRDFGNPDCYESNTFFSQTQMKVDGTQKALKDITEEDTDIMSDTEYKAYEDAFVQIYSGQKV